MQFQLSLMQRAGSGGPPGTKIPLFLFRMEEYSVLLLFSPLTSLLPLRIAVGNFLFVWSVPILPISHMARFLLLVGSKEVGICSQELLKQPFHFSGTRILVG